MCVRLLVQPGLAHLSPASCARRFLTVLLTSGRWRAMSYHVLVPALGLLPSCCNGCMNLMVQWYRLSTSAWIQRETDSNPTRPPSAPKWPLEYQGYQIYCRIKRQHLGVFQRPQGCIVLHKEEIKLPWGEHRVLQGSGEVITCLTNKKGGHLCPP
jgi:hypothetical protein